MKKLLIALGAVLLGVSSQANADRLSQMISPAFHPVTFEDPRNLTEARLLYVHHTLQDDFATAGGDVNVYALQARVGLTDKLSLIATKDGIVDFNPNSVFPKKNGIADIEAGLKYTLMQDNANGQIVSAALRYLIPVGDEDVLQGNGDGELHPSVSAAYALNDKITFTVGTGLRLAMDSDYSSFWDLDAQVDYRADTSFGAVYPLLGVSLIQIVDDGKLLPIADEGQDFFNFGASDADGQTITSGIAGLRVRPHEKVDLGASYQFPFSKGEGNRVLDSRWTFDLIVRF